MLVLLFGTGSLANIEPRLTKLGIRCQRFTKDAVRDLNHDSGELVYLLPFKALCEPDWPQLRVRLAQANRCYIVVSDNISSAEIMNAARDGAYDVLLHSDRDERWLEALRKVEDAQKLWLLLSFQHKETAPTLELVEDAVAILSSRALGVLRPRNGEVFVDSGLPTGAHVGHTLRS